MSAADGDGPARPVLRIVRGAPSPEEIAALTAVLASAGGDTAPAAPGPRSVWADPASRVRRPLRPGPGAWRTSGWAR